VSVACVGDNCIDRYVAPVRPDMVGGNALNVAVGLARRGLETAYLGATGDDDEGRRVVEALAAVDVDTSRITIESGDTAVTIVELTEGGDRVFLEERFGVGTVYHPSRDDVAFLRGCEWVHAAGLRAPATLMADVEPMRTSYDFSQIGPGPALEEMAPLLEVAFLSGAGMPRPEAVELARATVAAGARLAVVTRGREGSIAWNGRLVEQPAVPVEVVDTLGAGDALIAGVIEALLDGADLAAALAAGGAAAAQACTHFGAWQAA
jgi:fructoselysine 6-kinase